MKQLLKTTCLGVLSTATTVNALDPLVRMVELKVGEAAEVELHDGSTVKVVLRGLHAERDTVQNAARITRVKVQVNGEEAELISGAYRLPVAVGGVQIDCFVTSAILVDSAANRTGLTKDALFRLWPADSEWIRGETFVYPIEQRWFAGEMQSASVPVYVAGEEHPGREGRVYYHAGVDFGGVEGMTRVVAATDGLVVTASDDVLDREAHAPADPRYDVVYVLDDRGWYYRYSHLHTIDPSIQTGERVRKGQLIGLLGKEGGSGGWAHLHFDIRMPMPSGHYGIPCAYAFLWQAYRNAYDPSVTAHARPHQVARVNEPVTLDASLSRAHDGLASVEWTLSDGRVVTDPQVQVQYNRPGTYSEILKVVDVNGEVDYDFAVVQVFSEDNDDRITPKLHIMYEPTLNIRAGDSVHFAGRAFRVLPGEGEETWDFGDGSESVTTQSRAFDRDREGTATVHDPKGYAFLTHAYKKPGDYIVTVERTNREGYTATARVHVRVNP